MPLLNQSKNKSTEYFKNVFDNYFDTLVCFALQYVNHDNEAAQDFVQESFIELWNSDIINNDIERIKSFLYVTTRNKALNYLKHEKVKHNYFLENKILIESERFYMDQVIEQETVRIIKKAIDTLPEQTRKIVLLSMDGLKNKEIALQADISVDTVKYHKSRAYKFLKEKLKNKIWLILPALI